MILIPSGRRKGLRAGLTQTATDIKTLDGKKIGNIKEELLTLI